MSDFSIIRDGAFEASMSGTVTWEPTPEWDRWWKLQVVIMLRNTLLALADLGPFRAGHCQDEECRCHDFPLGWAIFVDKESS
jgi:hypothetical protein